MDWLSAIQTDPDYQWHSRNPGAAYQQVAQLEQFAGRPLPDDYVAFLKVANGAALSYKDVWYMRVWAADDIPAWSAAYGFTATRVHGALVIGDNGGSEALLFDLRPQHPDKRYPVCALDFVSLDWNDALRVADTFQETLQLRHPLLGEVT